MNQPVVIKASPSGLILYLDPELPFPDLLNAVTRRFTESAAFFKNARVSLTIRGRKVSAEEERQLVDAIISHARLQIICLMDEDPDHEEFYKEAVSRVLVRGAKEHATLRYGSLHAGETMEETESVVIFGDVPPSAKVNAQGNIIILGNCMGSVHAGAGGDETCFVAALSLKPHEVRIGARGARSPFTKITMEEQWVSEPRIAYLKDEQIQLDALDARMLHLLFS